MDAEYASKGVAGTGLGLGIAGTFLGLANNNNNGGILGGILGGNNNQTVAGLAVLAEKDAEIARLRSEKYADGKTNELFQFVYAQNKEYTAEFVRTRERLAVAEAQIVALNATVGAITVTRIPNSVLCPGVPAVTVSNTTAATA